MANYDRASTSALLDDVGARLNHRPGVKKSDIATYRKYDKLWHAPGPLSKEAEAQEAKIRKFCARILDAYPR